MIKFLLTRNFFLVFAKQMFLLKKGGVCGRLTGHTFGHLLHQKLNFSLDWPLVHRLGRGTFFTDLAIVRCGEGTSFTDMAVSR